MDGNSRSRQVPEEQVDQGSAQSPDPLAKGRPDGHPILGFLLLGLVKVRGKTLQGPFHVGPGGPGESQDP